MLDWKNVAAELKNRLDGYERRTDIRGAGVVLSAGDGVVLLAKAGADGRYTPESVWTAWKDWEFGQKKEPSPWLTLLVDRIERRCS